MAALPSAETKRTEQKVFVVKNNTKISGGESHKEENHDDVSHN